MAVPSGTFPVYLSPRLLAELVQRMGYLIGDDKPAASTLIRLALEKMLGSEEVWDYQDTQLAIDFLRERGYSTKQFTGQRFMKGQAREELEHPEQETSAVDIRRQELLRRMLSGDTLTPEEQEELER